MTTETTLPMSTRQGRQKNRATNALPGVARVLLGLFLLASGMAGLLHLTPPPPPNLPAAAVAFNVGMMKTGYMMPLIFGTQNRCRGVAAAQPIRAARPRVAGAVSGQLLCVSRFSGASSIDHCGYSGGAGTLFGMVVSPGVLAHARRARDAGDELRNRQKTTCKSRLPATFAL